MVVPAVFLRYVLYTTLMGQGSIIISAEKGRGNQSKKTTGLTALKLSGEPDKDMEMLAQMTV